jgi:hypothetical protein
MTICPECEGTIDGICCECCKLPTEIERLLAIVAKLPKTADGVPVVPGMRVWWVCNRAIWAGTVDGVTCDQVWLIPDEGEHWGTWSPSDCYSTREAAEKAAGEE